MARISGITERLSNIPESSGRKRETWIVFVTGWWGWQSASAISPRRARIYAPTTAVPSFRRRVASRQNNSFWLRNSLEPVLRGIALNSRVISKAVFDLVIRQFESCLVSQPVPSLQVDRSMTLENPRHGPFWRHGRSLRLRDSNLNSRIVASVSGGLLGNSHFAETRRRDSVRY